MGRKAAREAAGAKDAFVELAGHLRTKHGIAWRHGVAQGDRVEFFRGKDFAAWFREHPAEIEKLGVIEPLRPGRTVEAQIEDVYVEMARRRLFVRADRMYKKPKPGRKKLVKWPKKLLYEQYQNWDEGSFYCWTFDRPTSPWLWLGSALLVVIVFGLCLFPLAPYSIKISVVYLSMSLLGLIFGLLFVRAIVFSIAWIVLGRHFWLLPNVTSDELGIVDSFFPLYEFSLDYDGSELPTPHWATRLGTGLLVVATCYGLHEYAPSKGSVKTGLGKAHDSILDFLDLHDPGMKKITDAANATMNTTADNGGTCTGGHCKAEWGDSGAGDTAEDEEGSYSDPTAPEEQERHTEL